MKRLLAVAVLSFFVVGCSGVPHIVVRQYQDSVGNGYLKYLEADEVLDANSKRIRRQAVESMEKLLVEAGV